MPAFCVTNTCLSRRKNLLWVVTFGDGLPNYSSWSEKDPFV